MTRPTIVIERSIWRNANHGTGESYLMLNSSGFCCIWGFVLRAAGFADESLGQTSPRYVEGTPSEWHERDDDNDNKCFCNAAMNLNDTAMSDEVREERLTTLFRKNGYNLEFIGDYYVVPAM